MRKTLRVWEIVGLAVSVLAGAPATAQHHLFDPNLLGPARDPKRTPEERSLAAVGCIREEVRRPTTGPWNEAGTRHHTTMRMILVGNLAHHRVRSGLDQTTIRRASLAAPPGEERDMLFMLRGLLGDNEVTSWALGYLKDVRNPPYYRGMAIRALGELRPPEAVTVLANMLDSDPIWKKEAKRAVVNSTRSTHKHYMLREEAYHALKCYQRDLLLPAQYQDRLLSPKVYEEFE